MTVTLSDLNAADAAGFAAALDGVFEHAPWVAAAAAAARPFTTVRDLFAAMTAAVLDADAALQVALLVNHPPLGRRRDEKRVVAPDSVSEHAGAGLDDMAEAEFARYARLNADYRARFGFPFVLCVRRHGKESILRDFERRLTAEPAAELETGLGEVIRIAALRVADRVEGPGPLKTAGRLSTHVLDTANGRPAAGVQIELVELGAGPARLVASAVTNAEGRTDAPLIGGRPAPIARYELRFGLGAYFRGQGVALPEPAFLDVVTIAFGVADPEAHYHVPLTATPWSYATYRGS
jgi:2-oxo-4-hydroxy-4-carboxy-5-ureidoimidazoline decarboxylase